MNSLYYKNNHLKVNLKHLHEKWTNIRNGV